jgi:hypothetical protein
VDLIGKNQIDKRGESQVEIRLKDQIQNRILESQLTVEEVKEYAKSYPDAKKLFEEIGDNGTMYNFGYIMQSHVTH